MFAKLQERKIEPGNVIITSEVTSYNKKQTRVAAAMLNEKMNMATISEKSILLINNTLNKLFTQGLLNKFHSKEEKSILILTKNLSEEIRGCINSGKYVHDIGVNHINEVSQVDSKIDIIIAFDFDYETIFFNEISELTRKLNVPMIQFGIADESLFMGPVYLSQSHVK